MASIVNKKVYPVDADEKKLEQDIIDAIKKVPVEKRIQLIALNNLILQKKQLDKDMEAEMDQIVAKFNKLSEPLEHKASNLIIGAHKPSDLEIESIKTHLTEEERGKIAESLNNEPIPDYWVNVFKNCEQLSQDVFEVDHPILKHLRRIEHVEEEGTENYTLKFHFAPNEFFENEVLTARFVMLSESEVDKIEGTDIKWKEGKDITKKTVTKKQKNKKTGKTRSITKTVDADSFFNFFKSIQAKGEKEGDEEEEDDETLERLDINLDISRTIVDDIIPYHLEFFLGVRQDELGGGAFGDEDDEDFGGEDDEDSEDEAPKKGKGKKKF